MRAEFATARPMTEEMLALAQEIDTAPIAPESDAPGRLADAHYCYGHSCFYMGELDLAQRHFEQAVAIEASPAMLAYAAMNVWLLGHPDQAKRYACLAASLARRQKHPFALAFTANLIARLCHFMGRMSSMVLWAEKSLALSSAYEMPYFETVSRLLLGRILVESGAIEAGIKQLNESQTHLDAMNHFAFRTHLIGLLAEGYGKAEQFQEALDVLDMAITLVQQNREHFWHAELVRLRGDYLRQQCASAVEIESCYQEAVGIARAQNAKSLELRATMSLALLWRDCNRRLDAQRVLADVYDWFTEGFSSADLQSAGALLADLAGETG